jgi:hypothetical protein
MKLSPELENFDWSRTSYDGAEHEQFLAFNQLSIPEKLQAMEDLADFCWSILQGRRDRGLPYFDPVTKETVYPPPPSLPKS